MNILEFRREILRDMPHMRRPETQHRWDAFLAVVYGLPLDAEGLAIFREHTGRTTPRPGGYPEAVVIKARQTGGSQTGADIVAFEAATAPRDGSADGTYALAVAQDQRGTIRTLMSYIRRPFERVPMLAGEVTGSTADSLTLRNGVVAAGYPCRPSAPRGIRCRVAVVDELAFFRTSDGNPVDTEMLRALRPTLATTGGKLIIISSPFAATGALWELRRAHWGRDESATLIWAGGSADLMNPTLPADYIARMQADDPEAYRSEVLGEFRSGSSMLFDPSDLDPVTAEWRERLPEPGRSYVGHYDASGGRRDAAAAAVSTLA